VANFSPSGQKGHTSQINFIYLLIFDLLFVILLERLSIV
jgi:hypothetical protein